MLNEIEYCHLNECLYSTTLQNGLKIYLLPKPDFKEMSALLEVEFGSIDTIFTDNQEVVKDPPSGIAHFLEHKLFEMSDGQDAVLKFSSYSADVNAFTGFEKTAFYFSSLGGNKEALDLLQCFVMSADFNHESIMREKKIIAQELDMYLDDPDYRLYNEILKNLYPNTKLSDDVAGDQDSLSRITSKQLYDNHQYYYKTNNMTLFLVGDFNVEEVLIQIEKSQTGFTKKLTKVYKNDLKLTKVVKRKSLNFDVVQPKLALGFRLPSFKGQSLLRQKICLRLFLSLLFGWTSRRYQKWYDRQLIDDSFGIEVEVSRRFQFVILSMDSQQPIKLANQVRQVLKDFTKSTDFTSEHLELLKRELYGDFIRSLDSIEDLIFQLASYQSDNESYLDFPKILEGITLETIQKVGQTFIEQMETSEFTIFPN
ncbi:EF-P 5-aminopentanol modification-associated protein YfmH [Streptococcus dentapri]|uniref:EF-P 5-aminopentanol modification-associated protein YfmH n=1 Tax=Streptococcus dentapri TaxID=573564 RepID=A0ABV8D1X5_9STRE